DIVIADNLNAVAPWVAEVEERALEQGNPGSPEGGARRLLIVDHEAEMAAIVRRLFAPFLKGDELVAQIAESHRVTLAAQLNLEEAAIEHQRLLDVSHLQRDVVEAHDARLCRLSHQTLLLCQSEAQGGDGLSRAQPAEKTPAEHPPDHHRSRPAATG